MSHEFRPGEVISYPYLWAWQQQRGETEGRKPRPVCIVIAIRSARDGNTHLVLLAITTQPPQAGRIALEIPDIERRRAGLGDLKQSWIVVDEYNYDIVEHSWYIEPYQAVLGRFSKSFVMKIAALFAKVRSQSGQVKRFD
ncbi:hypothetical protein RJJ65_05435 [Rhizobium hidalgonense]|uniref:Growth inhibitor PemK n=1 Tax=Rhizobium hidalgonense TaxID=1538159 RepID=A0A2A6KKP7_9HYPH|nr:hypothetical protein [Rhizobium hidalgonense]MDR9772107.1 hypothetical protein [Rhizobium hidalgonense]MDR9810165.1 hypothetical protein [Rhizobium hidalgonense]MDR9817826.1 hypothetical protein [Rhizobium hidalgonense]PDT24982.1 hypothetical protein CO674_02880 [Rhizobium hidalgonense]PON06138.1 hypothetical protein ATY29_17380 [Rhizobium hidalgonense]